MDRPTSPFRHFIEEFRTGRQRVAVLALFAFITSSEAASACNCGPKQSIREAQPSAEVLLQGTVASVWPTSHGNRYRVRVEQAWRGVAANSGKIDVFGGVCEPTLKTGQTYLVFAYVGDDGRYALSPYCSPTQLWRAVSNEDRAFLGMPLVQFPQGTVIEAESAVHRTLRFGQAGLLGYWSAALERQPREPQDSEGYQYLKYTAGLLLALAFAGGVLVGYRGKVKRALFVFSFATISILAGWRFALGTASLVQWSRQSEFNRDLLLITLEVGACLTVLLAAAGWQLLQRRSKTAGVILLFALLSSTAGCAMWGYREFSPSAYGHDTYFE